MPDQPTIMIDSAPEDIANPKLNSKEAYLQKEIELPGTPVFRKEKSRVRNAVEQMRNLFISLTYSPNASKESLAESASGHSTSPHGSSEQISLGRSSGGSSALEIPGAAPVVRRSSLSVQSATHLVRKSSSSSLINVLSGPKPVKKEKKRDYDLDGIIKILIDAAENPSDRFPVSHEDIKSICKDARELTLSQPILLELTGPIHICGDIHGQFKDLLTMFDLCGYPDSSNFLFLGNQGSFFVLNQVGDYVDRGKQSMETILLQMCYKLKYPETFFLLRGNHECASINRVYGFFDECKRRSDMKIWKEFTNYFDVLPLAAIISGK